MIGVVVRGRGAGEWGREDEHVEQSESWVDDQGSTGRQLFSVQMVGRYLRNWIIAERKSITHSMTDSPTALIPHTFLTSLSKTCMRQGINIDFSAMSTIAPGSATVSMDNPRIMAIPVARIFRVWSASKVQKWFRPIELTADQERQAQTYLLRTTLSIRTGQIPRKPVHERLSFVPEGSQVSEMGRDCI